MSRWIDADALIEAMGEEPYVWTDSAEEIAERNQWLTDMHIIESAPSIDIVRCKECKHSKEWDSSAGTELYCGVTRVDPYDWSNEIAFYVKPDDFCSYGERRE